jgi:hypothetical protein
MSASPDDINALLAGAGLSNVSLPRPQNPALPTDQQQGSPDANQSMLQAMLALHGQANQQANIERQRKLADQMRADSGALMRGKQAGRLYVGPRWYDALADVAGNAEAMREDMQSNEKAAGLDADYQRQMKQFIDTWNQGKANIQNRTQ